jgi:hypothetical protein
MPRQHTRPVLPQASIHFGIRQIAEYTWNGETRERYRLRHASWRNSRTVQTYSSGLVIMTPWPPAWNVRTCACG